MAPAEVRPTGEADHEPPRDPVAVEVAWSPAAAQVRCDDFALPAPATLADAVRAAEARWGVVLRAAIERGELACSVWSRLATPDQPLSPGDRVELTRGLRVDPKEARRQRYRRHREARAGTKR